MKAMDRVSRGSGFRGLLNYLQDRDGEAPTPGRLIGGNMVGTGPAQLASEYRAVAKQRPDIKKPVWHQALRLPSGEMLGDDRWNEIVHEYLRILGLDPERFQFTVWIHDDEGAVHIAANRVAPDGSVFAGRNENLKSTRATQSLEKWFGLTVTKGPEYDWSKPKPSVVPKPTPAPRRKPKKGERQVIERTGELSVRQRLQEILDAALLDHPSLPEFVQRLAAWGVSAVPNLASTGTMNGFSFSLDGIAMKASNLGARYRWRGLADYLGYQVDRDLPYLRRLRDIPDQVVWNPGDVRQPMSMAPAPTPRPRQAAATWLEDLQRAVSEEPERFGEWTGWMDVPLERYVLTRGRHRVVAYEDHIEAATGAETEIDVMLELARVRGWKALVFTGDRKFKGSAMLKAISQGFVVEAVGEEDEELLAAARAALVATTANIPAIGNRSASRTRNRPAI